MLRAVLCLTVVLLASCAAVRERMHEPPHTPYPKSAATDAAEAADAAASGTAASVPVGRSPCEQPDRSEVPVLDDTREMLEETFCNAALWLDGLLGDEADIDAARRTHGRLKLSHYRSEFDGGRTRVRLKVRVELPAFKRRLSAFAGIDDREEFVRGRSETFAVQPAFPEMDQRDGWLAGLGYSLPGSDRFQSDFRIGARSLSRTKFFVQQRFGYNAYADDANVLHLRSTAFWTNRDGFGVTAGYDLSHVLSPSRLVRWDTVGTVSDVTEGLDWRSALILYQNLRQRRGIAYQTFVRGSTDAAEPLAEYGTLAIYRQPLVRGRLFVELVVGYSWPRIDPALPREGSFGAGVGFELPFGPDK